MSRESKRTRRTLIELCPNLLGQAIESPCTAPGIPDIWFTTCAVECKYLKRWPARPETPVSLDHPLTLEQFRWLNKRYNAGYPCWVVLQANRLEWLLFAAPDAHVLMHKAGVPRLELYAKTIVYWYKMPTPYDLQYHLDLSHETIENVRMERGLYETSRSDRIR